MHRRARLASTSVVAVAFIAASIVGAPTVDAGSASTDVPIVHIEGRGHGHGVGMSQWGAYTMARDGKSAAEIISTFYPGTALETAGGEVAVVIERSDRVAVRFPNGGEIRSARSGEQAAGFPVRVEPGGTVELVRDGAGHHVVGGSVAPLSAHGGAAPYQADNCALAVLCPKPKPEPDPPTTTTTRPPGGDGDGGGGSPDSGSPGSSPSDRTPTSASALWAIADGGGTVHSVSRDRTYRGIFSFGGPPGGATLRNHVDVEAYLKGMGEVPSTWPRAAVEAQAIAARTFALRAMANGGQICDSASCQVYGGTAYEKPGQSAAVDATKGTVVTYGGAFAATFYSASGGGHSATPAEGFGGGSDIPYLPAKPYPTANPKEWSVDLALADVAGRLGYPGRIQDIRILETGPSGRALRMSISGDAGEMAVDPQDFRRQLGLQSNWFTVRTSEAEAPPPPPAPTDEPAVVGAAEETPAEPVRRATSPTPTPSPRPAPITALDTGSLTPSRPPLALALTAGLLAATVGAVGFGHVTSRRRLHPVFALATTTFDLARRRGPHLVLGWMRSRAGDVATMTRWIRRR